jgi:hypothetical protein
VAAILVHEEVPLTSVAKAGGIDHGGVLLAQVGYLIERTTSKQ